MFSNKYIRIIFSKLLWLTTKIPVVVIGAFTVIGILVVGILLGLYQGEQNYESKLTPIEELRLENSKLKNVITGYEDLAMLYYQQGENLAVVLDVETLESEPQKAYDAISRIDSFLSARDLVMESVSRPLFFWRTGCPAPSFPPIARRKFACIAISSDGSIFSNLSRAASEFSRKYPSLPRICGWTSSARALRPESERPCKVRTREMATYPWPYSNAPERSMCAELSDMP